MAAVAVVIALLGGALDYQVVKNRRLQPHETVAKVLYSAGLTDDAVSAVKEALSSEGFNFKKARIGDQVRLVFVGDRLDRLDYRRNLTTEWQVWRQGDGFAARRRAVELESEVALVDLTVLSSVWDAAKAAGEKPDVAVTLSDVFAWDIDFYRDVQRGDRMRAIVEKTTLKGRIIDYGKVLAAEYRGSSVGTRRTFRYQMPDGSETYFLEDGTSARKTFLKSPLKFARVTSGFGGRFHPILNYFGSHNGVDYGAPIGTPVWAVADGRVTRAGWDRGGGNMVCLTHVKSLETCYLHLSKVLVRQGERVSQKHVIGETGSTGLSTGPHLHFALKRGGHFVNPLNQNFPRAEPLPVALLDDFRRVTREWAQWLDATGLARR